MYINQLVTKHNQIIDYNNKTNQTVLNKHIPVTVLKKKKINK